MKISNKLQKWVEQGLISQTQAEQILLSEQSKNFNIIWKWMYGIAGLLIGLGMILIVSANWDYLPAPVKLFGDFAVWCGIIYGSYRSIVYKKNKIKELFLVLSFLFIGATIGLIAQIFNLSGGWHSFATTWALLGLPFVLFSRLLSFNFCWICLFFSMFNTGFVERIINYAYKNIDGMILVLLCLSLLSFAGQKLDERFNKYSVLPKAFQNFSLFMTYVVVFAGVFNFQSSFFHLLLVYVVAFMYFALRLFLSIQNQNMISFKRNAIGVEFYVFLIFATRFGDLLFSGFGFIFAGIFILGFIYLLRKTSKYIKTMEVFHE